MLRQTHIVNVRFLRADILEQNGIIPEAEAVNAVVALRNAEEGFSVISLDTGDEIILSVQVDRAGIHHGVDAETLHEVGVRLRVQVIFPSQRNMLSRQHGIDIPVIDAVVKCFVYFVLFREQLLLLL